MTSTSEMDYRSLRSLAEAATPGPWDVYDGCSWRRVGIAHSDYDDCAVLAPTKASDGHPDLTCSRGYDLRANLAYIAAANPKAILSLLDRLEAVEGELDQWRSEASEVQEELQKIGEEFGFLGGEPRVSAVRRVLTEQRESLTKARYAIDRLQSAHAGKIVRDMDEALESFEASIATLKSASPSVNQSTQGDSR